MFDINKIRKDFPMLNNKTMQGHKLVFLDNASTTFKPQSVIDAMTYYYTNQTSNSHRGDYDLCYNMDVEISKSRDTIAKLINSKSKEVIFTSGDTESINLIAYGYAMNHLIKDDAILISQAEHASNSIPWFRVKEIIGCEIIYVELVDGEITASKVEEAFIKHPNIKLVSLAQVGNVLGYVADISAIAKIVHNHNALISVDGAQSVPHMPVNFKELDIDFLSFSAHKMCGPTGIGALIVKEDILKRMSCFITGGGMNVTFDSNSTYEPLEGPSKFEAGTLNISGIIGFKAAAEYLMTLGLDNIHNYEVELYKYLINKIGNDSNVIRYNKKARSSIFTFNIKGIFSQDEATLLNSKGIAVRSGQHCAKMIDGVINDIATVRMSTYFYTSKEEIDIFVKAIKEGGDILDAYFK